MNLADVRFDEATPDQFRKFWEEQGWAVVKVGATRKLHADLWVDVSFLASRDRRLSIGFHNCWLTLPHPLATFGEALRLANNLAQAELFGGWAE